MAIHVTWKLVGSSCSSNQIPRGTIKLKNIKNTEIFIDNLDLKWCFDGALHADFEVIIGIKKGPNDFSHIRRQYQSDVNVGKL